MVNGTSWIVDGKTYWAYPCMGPGKSSYSGVYVEDGDELVSVDSYPMPPLH